MALKGKNKIIDKIRDIIRAYKSMQTVPSLDINVPPIKDVLSFLMVILMVLVGPGILKSLIIKFLTKELDKAQESIKDALKSSLTSDSSSKSSGIPADLKSGGAGKKIKLEKIDKEGDLKQDRSTEEGKNSIVPDSATEHLQDTIQLPPNTPQNFKNVITTKYDDSDETITINAHSSMDDKSWASFINVLIDSLVIINSRVLVTIIVDYLFGLLSSKRFSQKQLVEKLKTDTIINKIKNEENDPFNLSKEELIEIDSQATLLSKGVKEIDLGCGTMEVSFDIETLNNTVDTLSLQGPQSIKVVDDMLTSLSDEVIKSANQKEDEETIKQGFLRNFLEILEFALIRSVIMGPQSQLLFTLVDDFKDIPDTAETTTQELNNRKELVKSIVKQIKGMLVKSVYDTFEIECRDLKNDIVPIYIKDVSLTYAKQLGGLFGIRDQGIIS